MISKKDIINNARNSDITYNEAKHTYTYVNGERFFGVTNWIASYCQPFDEERMSMIMARKENKTVKQVKQEWKESTGYGSYVHKTIEDYINLGSITESPELKRFINVMNKFKLTPVCNEWVIYNEDIKRASPVDLICLDEQGKIVIIDLKTMKKPISMTSYKDKKMIYPLNTLPDAKYFKQCLQIGIYKYWIEEKYKLPVADVNYVLRLRDDVSEMIPVMDVKKEVILMHEDDFKKWE